MKFSIGDKVILKRTGEEGHVTAFINEQMLEIEVNGTAFPVYIEEVDHPYLTWFTDKSKKKKTPSVPEQLPVEKEQFRKQRLAKGIYLSFLPVYKVEEMEDIVDHLKVYLLNELPQPIRFVYDVRFSQESEFKHEGALHAFGHLYLHNVAYGDMNSQPRFHWQLTDTTNKDLETEEGILRIRPAKLFEHITELQQKNEPTFSYLLIEDFVPKKKPEKKEKFIPVIKPKMITSASSPHLEAARFEIDLHIEQLTDAEDLSNAEIIKMQLDTLQHYLQLAIVHKQERMVVIHGLGEGKLKQEVHKVLKKTREVFIFTNEWHGRYGFGATEIYFRY
jgi:dsDNA-specific endonuclease/ATPase MutS2